MLAVLEILRLICLLLPSESKYGSLLILLNIFLLIDKSGICGSLQSDQKYGSLLILLSF